MNVLPLKMIFSLRSRHEMTDVKLGCKKDNRSCWMRMERELFNCCFSFMLGFATMSSQCVNILIHCADFEFFFFFLTSEVVFSRSNSSPQPLQFTHG